MDFKNISFTILTKNSEKTIKATLESLQDFEEVLIYDNGSTDETIKIAKTYNNTKVFEGVFEGFGKTHNTASSLAKNDWIFSIDSDEILSPGLIQELLRLKLEENTVYAVSRKNFYNGKWIHSCGWHPDFQYRLYNRRKTCFTNAEVHEQIKVNLAQIKYLSQPLFHTSYQNLSDFLSKMQHYSELFAKENAGRKRSSPWKALLHGSFAFFKSYFLKNGVTNGYEGFVISSYNGITAFYKYLKLFEKNQSLKEASKKSVLSKD
ncbi:glycosyltransferase family 2 protein [Criblamydia sequanensis]|uniref:Lipopolysaccharide core biosynthesis glycosyltransferase WaaE n=1 Tax=Candidatus Criblamydia sequanensis CRIB-18 TaxID=1437425 RepID=A0A090D2M2_9BACT|nr:glycosyltransferase family 2 protein [Criblamydia sequanensis]CDR34503.1 Putative lipopolysaccharide core biosynthesis glycosyltransferase WaaE [Criblamydia sequanensis CRIB-18]